jgi:hypothetical protein
MLDKSREEIKDPRGPACICVCSLQMWWERYARCTYGMCTCDMCTCCMCTYGMWLILHDVSEEWIRSLLCSLHSVNIQGKVQWTFSEHSVNIQWTFSEEWIRSLLRSLLILLENNINHDFTFQVRPISVAELAELMNVTHLTAVMDCVAWKKWINSTKK